MSLTPILYVVHSFLVRRKPFCCNSQLHAAFAHVFGCVAALCAAHAAAASEQWIFRADAEMPGARIVNPEQCEKVVRDGVEYLDLMDDPGPYEARSYIFEIKASALHPGAEQVLELVFYDQGAGLIRPQLGQGKTAVEFGRQQSITRLNTLRERSAFFSVKAPATGWNTDGTAVLSITGLDYLRGLRLREAFNEAQWESIRAQRPMAVKPMAALKRPMDLVTTGGVSPMGGPDGLDGELQVLEEYVPLAKVLGFNGIELYVRWNHIEPKKEGGFDFSYYDALVNKIGEYGMQWFPLLVVGSEYALPNWFVQSPDNVGFVCQEHGQANYIQSIWSPFHQRHVTRVLQAFGDHYAKGGTLLGVRLGPSGNFGESQYPAGGNWPRKGHEMHIHIGFWAGDTYARQDFQKKMADKYGNIEALNKAWDSSHASFDAIPMQLPATMLSKRQRIDFNFWYTRSMSDWCEWWAQEAARALPGIRIYQSAGGWGFVEAGTSYTEQAQAMVPFHGGIRLTNETDSFEQDFYVTRLAATAARHYGIGLGYEPASSHTARGVAGRIFNTATTNGDHLFTYHPNVVNQPMAIEQWLKYVPVLEHRAQPLIDVAVYYPETMNQLDDSTFRHLYAGGFYPRAMEIRRAVDVDYMDEKLIRDGFLSQYKALVFVWGDSIEQDVLARIDQWVQEGGTVLYPSFPRGPLSTIEGNTSVSLRWAEGGTGKGRFLRFKGDMEPPSLYGGFVEEQLRTMDNLHPSTKASLAMDKPEHVFVSVLQNGTALVLNYDQKMHTVQTPSAPLEIPAYGIAEFKLP